MWGIGIFSKSYRAGADQETFHYAKAVTFQSTVGFIPLWYFCFYKETYKRRNRLQVCLCSRTPYFRKLWALIFPQDSYPTPSYSLLHSTLCFPLKEMKPLLRIFCIFAVVTYAFTEALACCNLCNLHSITELQPVGSCDSVTPPSHRAALWLSAPEVTADLSLGSQLWPNYAAHLSGLFDLKGCCCWASWHRVLKTEGPRS